METVDTSETKLTAPPVAAAISPVASSPTHNFPLTHLVHELLLGSSSALSVEPSRTKDLCVRPTPNLPALSTGCGPISSDPISVSMMAVENQSESACRTIMLWPSQTAPARSLLDCITLQFVVKGDTHGGLQVPCMRATPSASQSACFFGIIIVS